MAVAGGEVGVDRGRWQLCLLRLRLRPRPRRLLKAGGPQARDRPRAQQHPVLKRRRKIENCLNKNVLIAQQLCGRECSRCLVRIKKNPRAGQIRDLRFIYLFLLIFVDAIGAGVFFVFQRRRLTGDENNILKMVVFSETTKITFKIVAKKKDFACLNPLDIQKK